MIFLNCGVIYLKHSKKVLSDINSFIRHKRTTLAFYSIQGEFLIAFYASDKVEEFKIIIWMLFEGVPGSAAQIMKQAISGQQTGLPAPIVRFGSSPVYSRKRERSIN